jgi:FkbM family methyltransferase
LEEERVVVLDVGAAGGVQPAWLPELEHIDLVMVEPAQAEVAKLEAQLKDKPSVSILNVGLSNREGKHTLFRTRFRQCSSLLEPNPEVAGRYRVGPAFKVVAQEEIECRRYDNLMREGRAPQPDVVKIDVQGAEKLVLEGMGAALDKVLGIEIESHFYPLYQGQALFGDMVTWLAEKGFRLRQVAPTYNFDTDIVEVNAWFTRIENLTDVERRKLNVIERVWELQDYPGGARIIKTLGI